MRMDPWDNIGRFFRDRTTRNLFGGVCWRKLNVKSLEPEHFSQLRSDNGSHFIGEAIREFLHLISVSHTLTLAYSKQENSIVVRYNKEINRHLRALRFENLSLTDYKKSLPFVQRILNSNHSDRSKIPASQMLFGNMLNLDKGIFIPQSERSSASTPLSQYMSDLSAQSFCWGITQNWSATYDNQRTKHS